MTNRMFKFVAVAALRALLSTGPYAQDSVGPSAAAVDAYFAAFASANRIPGLSVAVVCDGKVLFARGYGSDGVGGAMSPETRLCVGSVSKSFTALAILQLERRGLLSLDDPFIRYVPWFSVDGPGAEAITVRQLLTHTSGLDETGDPRPELPDASAEDEVRSLASVRPSAAPGERFVYYNKNYRALGYLVELLSGLPYGEYLRAGVFVPLGMTGASVDPAGIAAGTAPFFGSSIEVPNTYYPGDAPAGGLVMSAADAARYLIALTAAPDDRPDAVVGAGFVDALRSVPSGIDSRYGLGWRVERDGARLVHSGDVSGFHAYAEVDLDTGAGCVVLCRQNGLTQMLGCYDQLPLEVHSLLLGEDASDPRALSWMPYAAILLGAVLAAYHAWRFLALPAWFRKAARRPAALRFAAAILPVIPAVFFLCLPAVFTALLGLACSWSDLLHFLPDFSLLVVAGAAATIVRAALMLASLVARARPEPARCSEAI